MNTILNTIYYYLGYTTTDTTKLIVKNDVVTNTIESNKNGVINITAKNGISDTKSNTKEINTPTKLSEDNTSKKNNNTTKKNDVITDKKILDELYNLVNFNIICKIIPVNGCYKSNFINIKTNEKLSNEDKYNIQCEYGIIYDIAHPYKQVIMCKCDDNTSDKYSLKFTTIDDFMGSSKLGFILLQKIDKESKDTPYLNKPDIKNKCDDMLKTDVNKSLNALKNKVLSIISDNYDDCAKSLISKLQMIIDFQNDQFVTDYRLAIKNGIYSIYQMNYLWSENYKVSNKGSAAPL